MRSENTEPNKAIIFDFDGTVLDTESPDFLAWQEIGIQMGVNIPIEVFASGVGALNLFDPCDYIERSISTSIDRVAITDMWRRRFHALVATSEPPSGLIELLQWSKLNGYRLAIASSSSLAWIEPHLQRLGIRQYFDAICTKECVNFVKPSPDVYVAALKALSTNPGMAIAIEDSPVGVQAAQSAGIICVALPNCVTRHATLCAADLILHSFHDIQQWLTIRDVGKLDN